MCTYFHFDLSTENNWIRHWRGITTFFFVAFGVLKSALLPVRRHCYVRLAALEISMHTGFYQEVARLILCALCQILRYMLAGDNLSCFLKVNSSSNSSFL
mmetsp:Transcript_3474/g.9056  ORF Transcript_3474/g.9056 Transcript_3474/m.9056 type:complete len:100 (-) Transcript_3474:1526-1825(-)